MFTVEGNFKDSIIDLIKQGQNDKVKSCIKDMVPSELIDNSNTSLLHLAAKYNNCDLTKHLIKIRCNINAKNDSKTTPLMVAAMHSSFKTAQILIEADADIYVTNSSNKSALQLLLNNKKLPQYALNCCFGKVKRDSGSDKEIAENLSNANCPLHLVILLKMSSVTRMIMDRYAQVDHKQIRVAMDLALKLMDKENVSVLLQNGVGIDISNTDAVLFLSKICAHKSDDEDNVKLISAFLEKVTDWNLLEIEGLRTLRSIFRSANKKNILPFLQYNVNEYVKNEFPGQDLFVNIFENEHRDAKELLNHLTFDVNSRGGNGSTALHFAVKNGNLAQVQTLLEKGANPNLRNGDGIVPLSFLDIFSSFLIDDGFIETHENSIQKKILELLLAAGADPQVVLDRNFDVVQQQGFDTSKLQLILAQLVINERKGTPIKESIRQNIHSTHKVKKIYDSFCKRFEKLNAVTVHGSVTLYTILVSDAAKIAGKIHDRQALEAIRNDIERCPFYYEFHFYYLSKLKNSVTRIFHAIDLRAKASIFICEAMGLPDSQYIILEKIFSFLNYEDLLVFEHI